MIKKLRRRFIIVNMSILTSVLLGVLTGIYTFMYSSEVKISYELMKSILNDKDMIMPEPKADSVSAEKTDDPDAVSAVNLSFNPDIRENHDNRDNNGENFKPEPGEPDFPGPFPDRPEPNMPGGNDPEKPRIPEEDPHDEPVRKPTEPTDSNENGREESVPEPKPVDPKDDNTVKDESSRENIVEPVTSPASEDKSPTTTVTDKNKKTQNSTTAITTTAVRPDDFKPHFEKDFPDPYKGNVKRAYIMVQFDRNYDIERVAYQYFENADENEVKAAAKKIIQDKSEKGKITIGSLKLRYMKKDNPRMTSGGCRVIFLDRTLEISTINRLLFVFIIIGGVGIVVIFGISVLLANWMIKPVDRAWTQQKQFVADASHELKTPLTVISSNTDVILSNADDTVRSQSKWLNYIKEETKRMTKLVNSMLYIAKYDSNKIKFTAENFNLSDVLSSICLQYEALIFENGYLFDTEIGENIYIGGDSDKIKQLINILLDNAVKYSSEKGRIKVSLSRAQRTGKINLTVSNTSERIDPDKLARLFDRFYRLDDSRSRKTGGSGLGLNIAKSIADAHGGTIRARHENGITAFIVEI